MATATRRTSRLGVVGVLLALHCVLWREAFAVQWQPRSAFVEAGHGRWPGVYHQQQPSWSLHSASPPSGPPGFGDPVWAPQQPQYEWGAGGLRGWDSGAGPNPHGWENNGGPNPHGWDDSREPGRRGWESCAPPAHHGWGEGGQAWDDGDRRYHHPQVWVDPARMPPPQRPCPCASCAPADWEPSWEQPAFNQGMRWARSSAPRQQAAAQPTQPSWMQDAGVARPLGFVRLGRDLRVPVRDYRLILEHYLRGGWREATSPGGARITSASFPEFERSALKYGVAVPLSAHAAVPARTYCLVVRSASEPGAHAVLEVPDGRTCPLRQLADRPELSHWLSALFPDSLKPRPALGPARAVPQVWSPAASATTTTMRPLIDAPPAEPAPETHGGDARKDKRTATAHGAKRGAVPQGHQRRQQRLPEVWSAEGRDRDRGSSADTDTNSIDQDSDEESDRFVEHSLEKRP